MLPLKLDVKSNFETLYCLITSAACFRTKTASEAFHISDPNICAFWGDGAAQYFINWAHVASGCATEKGVQLSSFTVLSFFLYASPHFLLFSVAYDYTSFLATVSYASFSSIRQASSKGKVLRATYERQCSMCVRNFFFINPFYVVTQDHVLSCFPYPSPNKSLLFRSMKLSTADVISPLKFQHA